MAALNDPTPCPPPRLGARTNNQATQLGAQTRLIDAKPRRPRASRTSFGWDPTVDIYDDTFAFQRSAKLPTNQSHGAGDSTQQHRAHHAASRRTSLFGQPAQKIPLQPTQTTSDSDGDFKRRRISVVREDDTLNIQNVPQPSQTKDEQSLQDCAPLKKDPRRRTIYVPSDDTTIFTIHPGASMQDRKAPPQKPRRSDVFFDLAAVAEDENPCTQGDIQVPRNSRKSLAAAPRRGPLQPARRQVQKLPPIADIPGGGDGKENKPPGSIYLESKLAASGPNVKRFDVTEEIVIPPKNNDREILANSAENVDGKFHPSSKNPRLSFVNDRRNSSLLGNPAFSHSRRMSTLPQSVKGKPTLSPPERPPLSLSQDREIELKQNSSDPYPVLAEHIQRPEMYEDNWLTHQETAIAQLMNDLFGQINSFKPRQKAMKRDQRKEILEIYQDSSVPLMYKRLQASLRFGALSISQESLLEVARFKDDLGQRKRFLNLWMKTYDLSSLQTVAEIVIGRKISSTKLSDSCESEGFGDLSSNRKNAKKLESFLKKFLILHEDTPRARPSISEFVAKFDGSMNNSLESGSIAWLWRRTVLRSLMIIFLLDKSQETGKFQSCLFQTTSPFKSSSAVVQALAALVLPSVGDISRTLGHLHYQVTHVQYPLQEKQYHVQNLATDLRDGVLLTRLVEVLLYSHSRSTSQDTDLTITLPTGETLRSCLDFGQNRSWILSQHLRYPCVGRAQKLYNVQVALSALANVRDGQRIVEGIDAANIVDGHREKTLRLLWSLVGTWGLNRLVNFEIVRQEIRRVSKHSTRCNAISNHDSIEIDTNEELSQADTLAQSTQLLQVWASGVAAVHGIQVSNLSTSFSDIKAYAAIVDEYFSALPTKEANQCPAESSTKSASETTTQKSLNHKLQALGCSQAFTSLFQNTHSIPSSQTTVSLLAFLASRLLPATRAHFAAIAIQRSWRMVRARKELKRRVVLARLARDCAVVVGTRERIVGAAVTIQRWWRKISAF